jgi:hypothetical protein
LPTLEGRTALELVPGLEPFWIETYGRVALDRAAHRFQSGSEPMGRWFDVFAMPVEPRGHFAIVFRDITEERRVAEERAEALARAEALLEELNHRVMNSLGMIVSIIGLEAVGGARERAAARSSGSGTACVPSGTSTARSARPGSRPRCSADAYLGAVVERLGASLGEERGVRLLADIAPLAPADADRRASGPDRDRAGDEQPEIRLSRRPRRHGDGHPGGGS